MGSNTPEERIFDEFFDSMLKGEIRSPDEFLSNRGEVPDSLRQHLHRVFRMLAEEHEDPAFPEVALPAEKDLPWERLGDFRLIRRLGEGGMGVVFLAEQESLGRLVALKVLRPNLSASPTAIKRFEREAQAIARINHPHIVRVFAFGETEGVNYLAMELAPGKDLDKCLEEATGRGTTIEIPRVLRWCAEIAEALQAAHEQGIIHRDVKPSNVRIDPDDRALLLDFGVAREMDGNQETLTRSFLGSPAYMAPEQIALKGGQVDARSDVYSLGITLYQCLTGKVPFHRETIEEVFHDVLVESPPAPRQVRPELSRDLETVVLKAIDKEPDQRYRDATAFARDLRALLNYLPIEARPPGPWRRLMGFARRHTVATAMTLAIPVAIAALGIGLFVERNVKRTAILEQTRGKIAAYGQGIAEAKDLSFGILELQRLQTSEYMTPEQDRALEDAEDEVFAQRRSREESFYGILDLIRRAEGLGAEAVTVTELRGRLYMAKYKEAIESSDPLMRKVYRDLVVSHDPNGDIAREQIGPNWFKFECNVVGAEVYRFRYAHAREELGQNDRRWVPVPHGPGPSPVEPGTYCLEVVRGGGVLVGGDLVVEVAGHGIRDTILVTRASGPVQLHDRLMSIDGHRVTSLYEVDLHGRERTFLPRLEPLTEREFVFARGPERVSVLGNSIEALGIEVGTPVQIAVAGGVRVTAFHDGELITVELPPGISFLETAAPLVLSKAALIGTTPLEVFDVGQEAMQVLLVRAEGYEPQVFFLGDVGERVVLLPEGTSPQGFARVLLPSAGDASGVDSFWMQRHEVTAGEYFEFLNDPATLDEIERSATPIRRPRGGPGQSQDGCVRNPDGTYGFRRNWSRDLPIFGVSWHDARAYARWMTTQARSRGLPYTYSLPRNFEWQAAARSHWKYVFGDRFHPKWIGSCFAKPLPYPFRVMSFPIDRSLTGVFDISGNVSEWMDEWWLQEQGRRRHAGGSWSDGGPATMFQVAGGNGSRPDEVFDQIGFRVVLHMEGLPK